MASSSNFDQERTVAGDEGGDPGLSGARKVADWVGRALTTPPIKPDEGEALRRYVQHLPGCRMRKAMGQSCVCGLDAAVAAAAPPAPASQASVEAMREAAAMLVDNWERGEWFRPYAPIASAIRALPITSPDASACGVGEGGE